MKKYSKKNSSKIMSLLLMLVLVMSCFTVAYAQDADVSGGQAKDKAVLSEEPQGNEITGGEGNEGQEEQGEGNEGQEEQGEGGGESGEEGEGGEEGGEEPTPPPPHVHAWSDWVLTTAPTYVSEGVQTRYCACGASENLAVSRYWAYNTWVNVNGCNYYLSGSGYPVVGWAKLKSSNAKKAKVKWCYFNANGILLKTVKKNAKKKWVAVDGTMYYFTKKSKPVEKGIPYLNSQYKKFILIDISDQQMYCFKKGSLQRQADVVTGISNGTPTGTFKIRSKGRNLWLKGATWNSYVSYWMAFKGSAYGLHDASWRSDREFSNHSTYIHNGSHGCVNLRVSDAAWLYKWAAKGTPVIIQY